VSRDNILSLLECDIIIVPVLSVLILASQVEDLLLFLLLLGCLFVERSGEDYRMLFDRWIRGRVGSVDVFVHG
jgi:hypothetical protein